MQVRNKLYDQQYLKSRKYDLPVIGVGNLSVGGTGKSPMIEYLIWLLKEDHKLATLSRGYKRSSRGFHLLTGKENAAEVGDEPLQFKSKFSEVQVAVDENRTQGIDRLLELKPAPGVILLDDVFQHRKVQAGLYILLTSFDNLYSDDLVLPAGNLREPQAGSERADIVVVTKCPVDLSEEKQDNIRRKLDLNSGQELFFSSIAYSGEVKNQSRTIPLEELGKFTLVTGIADPKPLVKYLKEKNLAFEHRAFPDHHNFSASEVENLKKADLVLTTEKDYMRLKNAIPSGKLLYLPIETRIIDNAERFEQKVKDFVMQFSQ